VVTWWHWGERAVDLGTILLAAWLPVAGIIVALCLYALTEREADQIPARARGTSSGAEAPSPD
jgi:hypothetical protein